MSKVLTIENTIVLQANLHCSGVDGCIKAVHTLLSKRIITLKSIVRDLCMYLGILFRCR